VAGRVSPLDSWLGARTAGAPDALRERVAAWAAQAPAEAELGAALVAAGRAALDGAVAQGRDRAAALDLLTADALVTLALLARAEAAPASLGDFARQVRLSEVGAT